MTAGLPCAQHPDISLVVLTHDRRESLRRVLAKSCALPERPPIAVVDNGSRDGSVAMVREAFPSVTVLAAGANLGAAGRNLGAAWAPTRYVAFCDDDCWWQPGSLARAARLFDRYPDVATLTARILVGEAGHEDRASTCMAASPLPSSGLPGRAVLGLMAGATAFRTEAFRQAGGYEPRFFLGGEETLLALDLASCGWRLVYAPDLVVHHDPSPLRDAARRRALLARNAIWSAWLRLPCGMALAETMRVLPRLWREQGVRGCRETLLALPWVFRERHVVSPEVAAWYRQLRRAGAGTDAA